MKKTLLDSLRVVLFALILIRCDLDPGPDPSYKQRVFYAQRVTDNGWYAVTAEKLAESAHCILYADINEHITEAAAREITDEYEKNIYQKMLDVFGTILDVDNNGKVIFLLLDIQDGFNPKSGGGFVMGYFHPINMYKKGPGAEYSNEADMLYLDTNPLEPRSPLFYAAIAHELQHLINFSHTVAEDNREQDIWINEGLSTAAEYIYSGDPCERIDYFNKDPYKSIVYGNNFFVWDGYWENTAGDGVANYATAYLFFQWLRIHANNGTGIYKDILTSPHRDYQSVTAAAAQQIDSSLSSWETLLGTWMLANWYTMPSGLSGYKGEFAVSRHVLDTKKSRNLFPGEGIYSGPIASSFSLSPSGSIRYIELNETGNSSSFSQDSHLLTFNANTDNEAKDERGYLASTGLSGAGGATQSTRIGAGSLLSSEQPLLRNYPMDVHFNLDGSLSSEQRDPIQAQPELLK